MWYFTEIANWFEKQRTQSDAIVDRWVEESEYSQGVMLVAATTKAFTTFGAGFVDVLKLGDGVKEGTLKGVGTDAMRFVAIFPVGKAASMLKSASGLRLAKTIVDTGGGNCFWVASAKAFGHIGQMSKGKLLASVEDIANAAGMDMNNLLKIKNLSVGLTTLSVLGAKVGAVRAVATLRDVERMVPFDGSVLMMSVRLRDFATREIDGHVIYAFRTVFGQIQYMDRSVGNRVKDVYTNINDIGSFYESAIAPLQAAILHNVFVRTIGHELNRLVMPVLGVVASERKQ